MYYTNYIDKMNGLGRLVETKRICNEYFEFYVIETKKNSHRYVLEVICKLDYNTCEMVNGYFLSSDSIVDDIIERVKEDLKNYLIKLLTH